MASIDLQEKANFTRLSRLLVDKGTEALRNTFDGIRPPANLTAVLTANRTSLLKLNPRVINDSQWDLLYPPSGKPPDSKTFDVTLLTILFRNICGLPKKGWGAMPPVTDRSDQANIVRIRLFRNEVYAHVTSTKVDNATFEALWQNISQALVELNIPQNEIDDLKTCPLGPKEEECVGKLKDWKLRDEECITMLESLSNDVKSLQCSMDYLIQMNEEGIKQQNDKEHPQSSITRPSNIPEDADLEKSRSKENDDELLRKLAKHNFKSKIRGKVKSFLPGTREWLLKKVDEWFIGNEHESRILLLIAGPGFGKSVFAAKVCEDFKKKGKLAAYHFCDFGDSNLRNPMMMLQSLASQMCENVAGFKEKLLDQLKRPHEVRSLKDAFGIYLRNPLDELEVKEPSLVVIDGLDESAADDKNEIVSLIADYFPDLPDYMKVLVTSRPQISVAKIEGLESVNITNKHAENNSDLEIYLKSCLPHIPDRKEDNDSCVFKRLATMCEGSFLYAFYAQSELKKRDDLEKMTLHEILKFLPKGLDSIYQAYFKRLEEELKSIMGSNLDLLRVLELLVGSKGPLPLTFVVRVLGLSPDCRKTKNIISKVNMTVSCLLYVADDQVTVFHKSVIDWLLAMGYQDHEYTVKVSDGEKSLWVLCEQVFEEIKGTVCSGHDLNLTNDVKYALSHGLQHLIACNMKERFSWLVDVVIIDALLHVSGDPDEIDRILCLWIGVLRADATITDELRARISWHVIEIGFIMNQSLFGLVGKQYLESVLTHSPKGYFSDNEKNIAESLLSRFLRFVDISCNNDVQVIPLSVTDVPFIPLSVIGVPFRAAITAVALSFDKAMAVIALEYGNIILVCLPTLVELWQYSTEYEDISCCTFAPDDSFVLFGKLETVLSIAERKEVPFFHRKKERFTSCAFSPNGKRLVTSNGSNVVKLWDVAKHCLLSLLCTEVPIDSCSFSITGLFIIGDRNSEQNEGTVPLYDESVAEDSFCVWNAITWQRCDKRKNEGRVFRSELCKRCFPPTYELPRSKRLDVEPCKVSLSRKMLCGTWSTGIYNGVECIFVFGGQSLIVVENTHFITLAAWNFSVNVTMSFRSKSLKNITTIENDLWLYADTAKLIVFRTDTSTQEQSSCLACPAQVCWSSFSPDGSRLATCTSDGCVNIWNVDTSQVVQRFKCNQGESPFACWWSEDFLFVFHILDWLPRLSKYPVDIDLKILFSQSLEVLLTYEFVHLSAPLHFSEGFFIFECKTNPVILILDVNGSGGLQMVTLPGIEPNMSFAVSSSASFVFGAGKDVFYIWKRNGVEAPVYEDIFNEPPAIERHSIVRCCFSNDSKVAIVGVGKQTYVFGMLSENFIIVDLDTGNYKTVVFHCIGSLPKLFFCNKYKLVICAFDKYVTILDFYSGALIATSFQRYCTNTSLMQIKFSPNEVTLAIPKINGNMEFVRLSVPQNLSEIRDKLAIRYDKWKKENECQPTW